jgi:glyoxylase-like metal-dependent hydrolase (beta-lactamase superfamily II)
MISLPTFGHWSNSYLIFSGKEAAIVDPSSAPSHVTDALEEYGCELKYILLTHGHYDHTKYVARVKDATGAKVCVHTLDGEMLGDSDKNCYRLFNDGEQIAPDADVLLSDGDVLPLGGESIKVLHTPGHTKGSVCYIVGDAIFTGDTLFRGSVGRTDFYGGDERELIRSLRRIAALEGEYTLYPGHEGATTLNIERKFNRFLRFAVES